MAAGRHTIFPQSIHSLTFLIDYFILPSLTLFSFDGLSYIGSSTTSAHLLASILVYSNFPTVTQDKLSHLLKPYFQQLLLLILSSAKDITLGSLPSPTSTFSSLSDQSLQIHTFVSSIKKKNFRILLPQTSGAPFLFAAKFLRVLDIHFLQFFPCHTFHTHFNQDFLHHSTRIIFVKVTNDLHVHSLIQ